MWRKHRLNYHNHLKERQMASDQEQKSVNVPQHKRLAMGEKLDGTSYGSKGSNSAPSKSSKPQGGLSALKKK
jgi:hypothetical protein